MQNQAACLPENSKESGSFTFRVDRARRWRWYQSHLEAKDL